MQTGPELVVAGPLSVIAIGFHVVRRRVHAFREQAERTSPGQSVLARLAAADVEVLVPSHVHPEGIPRLQPTPGSAVTEHDPNQFQRDVERHLRSVVEARRAGREESVQPRSLQRLLDTEVHGGRDLWLANGQVIDSGTHREGLDRLQVRRLDLVVIAERVFGADVVAVFITVGGVVLGDAIDVGEHNLIFQHVPGAALRNALGVETQAQEGVPRLRWNLLVSGSAP